MSRYLVSWEANSSRWPTDQKEIASMVEQFTGMTKQNLKEGKMTSFGEFVGGGKGYAIVEGNAADVYKDLMKAFPYFTFEVKEVITVEEVAEAFKSMTD